MTPDSLPTIAFDESLSFTALKFRWRNFVRSGAEGATFNFLILNDFTNKPTSAIKAYAKIITTIGVASAWTLVTLFVQIEGADHCNARDWLCENRSTTDDATVDSLHTEMFNTIAGALSEV